MAADLILLQKRAKPSLLRALLASMVCFIADIKMLKRIICMIQLIIINGHAKLPINPKMKLIIDNIARVSIFFPNREN